MDHKLNSYEPYYRVLFVPISLVVLLFIISCQKSNGPALRHDYEPPNPFKTLTSSQKTTASYFLDIALGLEYGDAPAVTRKWKRNMKLYVAGRPSAELKKELHSIIKELNKLTSESNFSISVTADSSQSNALVFFGSQDTFGHLVPEAKDELQNNYGLFYIWWNSKQQIYRMAMYVDMYRTKSERARKHLLREELTQSLGLPKDSPKYFNSIFQSSYKSKVTSYSALDKNLIKLLYQPEMEADLTKKQTEKRLVKIIRDVVPD